MASVYTELKRGAMGNDVSALQTALSKQGYGVQATGAFDDATEAALKSYQQQNGLSVDGIAGNQTLSKLYGTPSAGANGYTPSASVISAQKYLESVEAGKPGAYQSNYADQLKGIYDKIMNREKFAYNVNGDALYEQYKDQYTRQGKAAMQDTMGQAAALTGGYGNSYAQAAGQQEYQRHMQALTDKVPELEQNAYARYQNEGNDMLNQYGLVMDREENEYGRYQDAVASWQNERAYAQGAYGDLYNREYGQYTDAQAQQQQSRQYAYQTAMSILQAGKMPTDALLSAAGLSAQDAKSLMASTKKSTSGSGKSSKAAAADDQATFTAEEAQTARAALKNIMSVGEYNQSIQKGTPNIAQRYASYTDYIKDMIASSRRTGQIDDRQLLYLSNYYGLGG